MSIEQSVEITGAMARKIGRLSALWPDAEIRIATIEGSDDAVAVEFLDEYGLGPVRSGTTGQPMVRGFVVRRDGWSNPSLARARAELAHAR